MLDLFLRASGLLEAEFTQWACGAGIISGQPGGYLDPTKQAQPAPNSPPCCKGCWKQRSNDMTAYEAKQFESEIYLKLKEAELEAKATNKRLSHEEVFAELRARVAERAAINA
jgi:hypothetical protein